MFEPLLSFTATDCTGLTDKLFFDEKPQLARVKGTTKKAEAFGLFVYPNFRCCTPKMMRSRAVGIDKR